MVTLSDRVYRETTGQLNELSEGLLDLERSHESGVTDDEQVAELFRVAHSLKGKFGTEGLERATRVAHALEDLLDAVSNGRLAPSGSVVDDALSAVDALQDVIDEAHADGVVETDPEDVVTRLQAHVEDAPAAGATGSERDSTESAGFVPDAGESFSPDVMEALEGADEFDDLDSLLAEVDGEPTVEDDDVRGWGVFERDEPGPNAESTGSDEPATDEAPDAPDGSEPGERETGDDGGESTTSDGIDDGDGDGDDGAEVLTDMNSFEDLRRDLEVEEDIETLQSDIDAEEFGEFDDDDDWSVSELLETEAPGEAAEAETERARPVGESTAAEDLDTFEAVRAGVDPEAEDLDALQRDIDATEFGEFDDDDELSIRELLDADVTELDPEAGLAEETTPESVGGSVAARESESTGTEGGSDASTASTAADESTPDTGDETAATDEPATDADDVTAATDESATDAGDVTAATDEPATDAGDVTASADESATDAGDVTASADESATDAGDVTASADGDAGSPSSADIETGAAESFEFEQVDDGDERAEEPSQPTAAADEPTGASAAGAGSDGETDDIAADPAVDESGEEDETTTVRADRADDEASGVEGPAEAEAGGASDGETALDEESVEFEESGDDRDEGGDDRDEGGDDRDEGGDDRDEGGDDRGDSGDDRDRFEDDLDQFDLGEEDPFGLSQGGSTGSGLGETAGEETDLDDALADLDGWRDSDGSSTTSLAPDEDASRERDAVGDDFVFGFGREQQFLEGLEFDSMFTQYFAEEGVLFGDDPETGRWAAPFIEETDLDAAAFTSLAATDWRDGDADAGAGSRLRGGDAIQSLTVDIENAETLLGLVEDLGAVQRRLERLSEGDRDVSVEEVLADMRPVTSALHHTVMDIRLMPLETAVSGLSRVVRSIARDQGKQVEFSVDGADVKLDRSIIERIGDPLVHLVRNAVDHGVEPPSVRERNGKPREGRLELRARRDGDQVVIELEDDGRGIDPDVVRQAALERGVVSEAELASMTRAEVIDLVFHAQFSTRDEVTEVSGRGVGLDVVERTVRDLTGSVEVESAPGEGTTVRLTLPVTVAVARVLFLRSGGEQFAIPTDVVASTRAAGETSTFSEVASRYGFSLEALETESGGLSATAGAASLPLETDAVGDDPGDAGPFESDAGAASVDAATGEPTDGDVEYEPVSLADAFETASDPATEEAVVRIDAETRPVELRCDDVGEIAEVVVRPFDDVLGGTPGINGTTTGGGYGIVPVIDVRSL